MNTKKLKVGFLCSSGGGDLIAINHAINYGLLTNVTILAVFTPEDSHLRTNEHLSGLPFVDYSIVKEERDKSFFKLLQKINELELDIVFLAGFKYIIPLSFIKKACPIINSHHSLLPAFPGLYKKEDVVRTDVGIIGHTLHYVDEGVDTGKKIIQMAMPNFKMDGFDKILSLYRQGADIMNIQTLLTLSSIKGETSMLPQQHVVGNLLFSEKIDQRVITYINDLAYRKLR
ncbi:formyltransferase family protein [Psychrosphaera aquimarina]|uniref:phosphoribosylglycinamide formyltransferase 1 n=1 Tax=Psychrosphaera aquimarina TaxID=2044854 RepID=A0ABU3R4G5_9GAMM|nr:formyltransferase family protein [Psychrosphaera aquimarina]MDU0114562.1 formyltransferase family protein [Psychrosphaera aquimarina]